MVYAVLWGLVAFLSGVQGVPRSVVPINAMVAVLAVGGSRMFARWLLRKIEDSVRIRREGGAGVSLPHQSRVVVFGAGAAGRQLAVGLGQSSECILLAFVDDGIELHGRDMMECLLYLKTNYRRLWLAIKSMTYYLQCHPLPASNVV